MAFLGKYPIFYEGLAFFVKDLPEKAIALSCFQLVGRLTDYVSYNYPRTGKRKILADFK